MVSVGRFGASKDKERRGLSFLIFVAIIGFSIARGVATFYTNFLWFGSIELTSVWWTIILTRLSLVAATSLIAFLFIFVNLRLAVRASPVLDIFDSLDFENPDPMSRLRSWVNERFVRFRTPASIAISLFLGIGASILWEPVLLYLNQVEFGVVDPIFNADISRYVYGLPLFRQAVSWAIQLVIVCSGIVGLYFIATGAVQIRQGQLPEVSSGAKAHLSVLLAFIALLKAAAYRLDAYDLLYSPRGKVFGASYTDVKAHLPALNLLILISIFGAILLLFNIRRRGWLLPTTAIGLWLAVSVIVGGIVPAGVQRFRVLPDELNKELPYVADNIKYTRLAYGLDQIEEIPFAGSNELNSSSLQENKQTVDNIRLWDPTVLAETYSQLQEIRAYYGLTEVDVDRYVIDGNKTQVMVAARELDQTSLPATGWVNERLQYTHGFGVVFSPANEVAAQGQPDFYVKGVPATTSSPELEVEQPRIYFGETSEAGDYVFVNTLQDEVDYPMSTEGQTVAYTNYSGNGGIKINSIIKRLGFALRYSDLNVLISNQLTNDSKVIMVRNILERVKKAAPFLYTDNDPYIALIDGNLFWIVDMYTVTDRYPYAQPADTSRINERSGLPGNFNYIRNSVKAVVNAYDGTMSFYVEEADDPLIRSYNKIFPELFTPKSEMPDSLINHVRYPEDLFTIQSDMYRKYHMTNPKVFYADEDPWSIPSDSSTTPQLATLRGELTELGFRPMVPYYLLMNLPGEEDLSYLILQPFNPENRPNMQSFLVANADPDDYGRLINYYLPKGDFVDGPSQVATRIQQDPAISQIFTLLDQQGSQIIKGNLFVVPINQSILYYQPIYLQGEENPLPEFKFVVVVYQDRIVMRDTLDSALAGIFGDATIEEGIDESLSTNDAILDLLARASDAFSNAQEALLEGDLGSYQNLIEQAERLVKKATELLDENNK
ncbi:MAG: UPF0182 family protein [Candidatus Actinomarinales bacterium]|nr:MAG: UPF0182 family protein [Candidatus Actinomarinales bacterium]